MSDEDTFTNKYFRSSIQLPIDPVGTTFPYHLQGEVPLKIEVSEPIKNVKLSEVELPTPKWITFPDHAFGYGIKLTIEEQYNKIQEELSELTRINNNERKEHAKIIKEKDAMILDTRDIAVDLTKERDRLKRMLARARARAKSYKDELKRQGQLSEALIEIEDLREEIRQLKDEIDWRKANR